MNRLVPPRLFRMLLLNASHKPNRIPVAPHLIAHREHDSNDVLPRLRTANPGKADAHGAVGETQSDSSGCIERGRNLWRRGITTVCAAVCLLGGGTFSIKAVTANVLRFERQGDETTLLWAEPLGVLEAADTPAGPWEEVHDAFSPYRVPTTEPNKFYRLRTPGTVDLQVAKDRIGIVGSDGISGDELQSILQEHELKLAGEWPGNIFVFTLPGPVDPAALDELASKIREEFGQVVVQAGSVVTPGQTDTPMIMTDQFIVQFRQDADPEAIKALNLAEGAQSLFENPFWKNHYLLRVTSASAGNPLEVSVRYAQSPLVEYAEPNFVLPVEYRATIPNDPLFANQWHLNNTGQGGGTSDADIDAPEAWDITMGNNNVIIAPIDSGFDVAHPDLAPNLWQNPGEIAGNGLDDDGNGFVDDVNGWDFNANDSTLAGGPHGTSVAGCAVARGNNLLGVSGSCPNGRLMPIRNGTTVMNQALAFDYARTEGASIITCSWGYTIGTPTTTSVVMAINRAATLGRGGLGCIVLFAMNNGNFNDCAGATPDISSIPAVIAVSATSNTDQKVTESAWGNCMDVMGPTHRGYGMVPFSGTLNITTTDISGGAGYNNTVAPAAPCPGEMADRNYTSCFGGTSAATPITAGIAGLILSVDPTLTRLQVQQLLQDTSDKVQDSAGQYHLNTGFSTPPGGVATHGYGRVNAFEAVRVAAPTPAGRGGVDVFIRDNRLDWGNTEQPSNLLFEPTRGYIPHWQSVDIKVDAPPFAAAPTTAAAFDAFAHENPVESTNNRVYVRVHNRGQDTAESVLVKLHWVFAGTALPQLPTDFWSVFPADSTDTSRWQSLGSRTVSNLAYSGASVAGTAADASQIVQFDFPAPALDSTVPAPDHYCLFAVVDSAEDPVSAASRLSRVPDLITPNDNNITHRNVSLQPAEGGRSTRFFVRNPFEFPILTAITHDGSPNLPLQLEPVEFGEPFQLDAGQEELFEVFVGQLDPNENQSIALAQEWYESDTNRLIIGGLTLEFGREHGGTGQPDLVVPEFEATGAASVNGDGTIDLPVRMIARNQGTGSARIFKSSVHYVVPPESIEYTVAFTVAGQSDLWYPWTTGSLAPGSEVTFNGSLTFHPSLRGQTVQVSGLADSTSGDEFLPERGRVEESSEVNNASAVLDLVLP